MRDELNMQKLLKTFLLFLIAGGLVLTMITACDAKIRIEKVGPMHQGREGQQSILLEDGRVLILGGSADFGGPLALTEAFNPATKKFDLLPNMIYSRERFTATKLQDGRILILGGNGALAGNSMEALQGNALKSAEIFDPHTNQFRQIADFPAAIMAHAATLLPDGKVLIVGATIPRSEDDIFIYNPATEAFAPWGRLLYRTGFKSGVHVTLMPDDKIMVTGGFETLYMPEDQMAQIIDYKSHSVSLTKPRNLAGFSNPFVLKNKKVLFIDMDGSFFYYDPVKDANEILLKTKPRIFNQLVLLRDDKVLSFNQNIDTYGQPHKKNEMMELFDPKTLEFQYFQVNRFPKRGGRGAIATVLKDGSILLVGGPLPETQFSNMYADLITLY